MNSTTADRVKLRTRSSLVLFAALTIAWVGTARAQLESLALYDDFTAPKISPTKWIGGEGRDELGLEAKRQISNGQLLLSSRSVGFTAGNTGLGTNVVYLGYAGSPDDVNEMKAAITVNTLSVTGCAANSDVSLSFAFLEGSFFNTASQLPGDQTNDVIAAVGPYRSAASTDPPGTLRVTYAVLQCTDKQCGTYNFLGGTPVDFPGTLAVGTAVNVEVQWDQPNHRFIFTKGRKPPVFVPYGVSDIESPGLPYKRLEVLNEVANCTTTTPRPTANITALFDNVMLNQSAVQ